MKKTISILSIFTISFFYSQDNNDNIKNENNNQIISKKDFNITSENRNIIKIEKIIVVAKEILLCICIILS